jgi:hypothetical protein
MKTATPTTSPALTPAASPAAGRLLQRKCACGTHTDGGGECGPCGVARLQRSALSRPDPPEVPSVVHDVLRSPGRPLDAGTRSFMEPRFAHDFSHVPAHAAAPPSGDLTVVRPDDWSEHEADRVASRVARAAPSGRDGEPRHDFGRVRVHTDARAADSASALNARAYTVGDHIVFAEGQYDPASSAGRELLAHELTHVAQTGAGTSSRLRNSLHRKTFETDEANCTATRKYLVQLLFQDRGDDKWDAKRRGAFRNDFERSIEDTFNANPYRIKPDVKTFVDSGWFSDETKACPCADRGFRPKLQIDLVKDAVWSTAEDWEVDVEANKAGDSMRSASNTSYADTNEEGVRAEPNHIAPTGVKQVAVVHEFGHFMGLDHPGAGQPGVAADEDPEYAYTGTDVEGHAVDGPTDLMGAGSNLRPFYFEGWREELEDKYGDGCGWTVVDPNAAPVKRSGALEKPERPLTPAVSTGVAPKTP